MLRPDEPVPYYPGFACWRAPLREGSAPQDKCPCRICQWVDPGGTRFGIGEGPVRPGTPEWAALMSLSGAREDRP